MARRIQTETTAPKTASRGRPLAMPKTPSANGRLTILFSGMLAGDPHQGGATWAVLQYLLGLRRLGHDVYFVEPVEAAGGSARGNGGVPLAASPAAAYFRQVMREFGLEDRAALLRPGTRETVGMPYDAIRDAAARADLLLNVSGMLRDPSLIGRIPVRAYLDLDPAFVQLWHATQGIDMGIDTHNRHVTVGLAIGEPGHPIPTCGVQWIGTFQPVILEAWPVGEELEHDAFTTVANWRGYGSIEHEGTMYGQKAHAFRPLFSIPTRSTERFEVALAIHPDEVKDLSALCINGWKLLDPREVAGTPASYRRFVRGSKGELGVAKSGYVASRCGWFSDRSACYLASGRPVVAQDTGFPRFLPTGNGLHAFTTAEEAVAAVADVVAEYPRHRRAARDLAEAYFDSDTVLNRLLAELGAAA